MVHVSTILLLRSIEVDSTHCNLQVSVDRQGLQSSELARGQCVIVVRILVFWFWILCLLWHVDHFPLSSLRNDLKREAIVLVVKKNTSKFQTLLLKCGFTRLVLEVQADFHCRIIQIAGAACFPLPIWTLPGACCLCFFINYLPCCRVTAKAGLPLARLSSTPGAQAEPTLGQLIYFYSFIDGLS